MNILLAMNNTLYSDYLSYRLELLGHQVTATRGGISTLDSMKQQAWDLLIIGLFLTDMNGLEVIASFRRCSTARFPIIMLTRANNERIHKSALALGVTHYLSLPQDTDLLLSKIKDL